MKQIIHISNPMRKKIFKKFLCVIVTILLLSGLNPGPSNANPYIVGVKGTNIQTFSASDYSPITDPIALTMADFNLFNALSITYNNSNNEYYILLKTDSPPFPFVSIILATVDPLTGICTYINGITILINPPIHEYSTITYSSDDSTLYSIYYNNTYLYRRLVNIDIATGDVTNLLYMTQVILTNRDYINQIMAYNNSDGYIYDWYNIIHWIYPQENEYTLYMEKINRITYERSFVPMSGLNDSICTGVVYTGGDNFLLAMENAVYSINSQGEATEIPEASALSGFGGFAYIQDIPLPVELTSFSASVNSNDIMLNWTTASETNNFCFDIERSQNSVFNSDQWIKAGNVKGTGNSSIPVDYTFTDKNLKPGKYTYRLEQTDYNGNSEYFYLGNDVVIGIPAKYELSQNYPNPFNPETKISFNIPIDGKVKLVIYDNSGKEVSSLVNEFRTAGYYTINFNASGLSSGVYYYKFSSGEFSDVKKMIVVK